MNGDDIQIAARIPRSLYEQILKRRKEAARSTGIEPSIAAVVRLLLERGLETTRKVAR